MAQHPQIVDGRQLSDKLKHLDQLIGETARDLSNSRRQREVCGSELLYIRTKIAWNRTAVFIRSPTDQYDLWPVGLIFCGPLLVGTLIFAIHCLATDSISSPLWSGAIASTAATLVLGFLLFHQHTRTLRQNIHVLSESHTQKYREFSFLRNNCRAIHDRLVSLKRDRKNLIGSLRFQREQLLNANWKSMRGVVWEDYLEKVFRLQGYEVKKTKTTGDQGVDLVVSNVHQSIAIQAKGYFHSVGNAAIQQVVAGKTMYKCGGCAVITNSKFTPAAIELASSNNCTLISEDNFEDFVHGRVRIMKNSGDRVAT